MRTLLHNGARGYKHSIMVKLAQKKTIQRALASSSDVPVLLLNQAIRFNKIPQTQISKIHLFSYTWEFNTG